MLIFAFSVIADMRCLVRDNFRVPRNHDETVSFMEAARLARNNTPSDASFFVAGSAFGIIAERRIYLTDKAGRNCPACRQATLDPDCESLLRVAKNNNMNFAVLKKDGRAGRVSGAIYENEYYAVLPVN